MLAVMKLRLIGILILVLSLSKAIASPAEKSMLKLRLTTGELMAVKIDDRDYNKYARSLTIGDLPRGWHRIRVYHVKEYKDGGANAKLVYSGRIKIKKGVIAYCEIDPGRGRMSMNTRDIEDVFVGDSPRSNPPDEPVTATTEYVPGILTDKEFTQLELKVQELPTDVNTLKTMKADLKDKKYTTSQVKKMTRWLAFDDSKKDFAVWAYSSVTDKENYAKVAEEFSLDNTKKEFHEFLAQQD